MNMHPTPGYRISTPEKHYLGQCYLGVAAKSPCTAHVTSLIVPGHICYVTWHYTSFHSFYCNILCFEVVEVTILHALQATFSVFIPQGYRLNDHYDPHLHLATPSLLHLPKTWKCWWHSHSSLYQVSQGALPLLTLICKLQTIKRNVLYLLS